MSKCENPSAILRKIDKLKEIINTPAGTGQEFLALQLFLTISFL